MSQDNKRKNSVPGDSLGGAHAPFLDCARPLGVYIHIPFCAKKCRYCDFLSFPIRALPSYEETAAAYIDALCEEIRCFFEREPGYVVDTVYFGGGTPSMVEHGLIGKVFDALSRFADIRDTAEITIEANPGTLTLEKLYAYRSFGINRISLGLQSTEEKELSYLGRIHSYPDFCHSYEMAVRAGFDNINVDLMSAIPYQTLSSWEKSLRRVAEFSPAHLSAYSLIVEEGTPFYEEKELFSILPDEDTEREMYDMTDRFLRSRGYRRYEISNYAKEGKECRHNLVYWDRGDYIGFGLGAASCIRETRFKNTESLPAYIRAPWRDYGSREEVERLSIEDQMAEAMILGLRKIKGVSKKEFARRYGRQMEDVFPDVLSRYEKAGLLAWDKDRLTFTPRGLDLSNIVLCEFMP